MKKLLLTLIAGTICAYAFALTSITTKKVNGSPFCGGTTVSVSYTIDAPANAGNVFTAQLSDKSGSFASPVNIGTLSSTGSGTISATLPLGTKSGSNYKIRVISSSPAVIGSPCPNKLKINPTPTNLTVTGITGCQATLNWTGTANASSYKVQYKKTSSSDWSATIDVGLATSYMFTGLSSGTSYDFQVRAACSNGAKSSYAKITSSTLSCPTPTGLIVTAIGITTSSLNWNDASCVTDYSFRYRPVGATLWIYKHPVPSNIDLTGLLAATLYEAQVATRCSPSDSSAFTASVQWETNYFRLGEPTEPISALNVFPNPSNGVFTVQFNSTDVNSNIQITVQNIYGQIVFNSGKSTVAGLNEERIELSDAAPGLYFVTIKSGDQEYRQSLLVK